MGEVWRAVDTDKDREVALKVLGSWLGGDPQFAERFRRESALAARLNSPHIVPIHDYGEIDGRLFIDMPLIDGSDLAELLKDGPLPPARAVRLVEQVARALDVAHRAGLVHRDVKPSNVLVCPDSDDHTYLIDFGIAKALDGTRLSMSGGFVGTAAYMAPECFVGEGDARSDVYSLGCVLFEALTGQPPFAAPHAFAYGHLHRHEPPSRLSDLRRGVPRPLDDLVARALAKAPAERFLTTIEFGAAARSALTKSPVDRPVNWWRSNAGDTPATEVPAHPSGPVLRGPPSVHRITGPAPPPSPAGSGPARTHGGRWLIGALLAAIVLVTIGAAAFRPSGSPPVSIPTPPPTTSAPIPNLTLTGHTDTVYAAAVTELDGRPVAVTGSEDTTVRIWDLSTGQQRGRPLTGHTDEVWAVATTQLDGRPVAVTGAADDTVRIWDLTTGQQRGQPLTGHTDAISAVVVTELDGRPVAVTGAQDNTIRVWDLTTGRQRGEPLTGHTDTVFDVVVAELDGRPVAVSASRDATVRIWDLTTGQQRGQPLTGHTDAVAAVTVTELDGRPVAVTGSNDNTIRIWDLTTGEQRGQPLTGHTGWVQVVAPAQLDGRPAVVTGSEDDTVRIWDLTTGQQLGKALVGHTDGVRALAVAPLDGRTIAVSGGYDRSVRTWDLLVAAGL